MALLLGDHAKALKYTDCHIGYFTSYLRKI